MGMVSGTAVFSDCGRYRYVLTRSWDAKKPELLVVMLNPSTADAAVDDPTIRRVIRFADDHGYGELRVMNLYALCSADPEDLGHSDIDPVGPENERTLGAALAGRWMCDRPALAAWGATKWSRARASQVLTHFSGVNWVCLGTTKDGSPRHPLYVPASQRFVPYRQGVRADG